MLKEKINIFLYNNDMPWKVINISQDQDDTLFVHDLEDTLYLYLVCIIIQILPTDQCTQYFL